MKPVLKGQSSLSLSLSLSLCLKKEVLGAGASGVVVLSNSLQLKSVFRKSATNPKGSLSLRSPGVHEEVRGGKAERTKLEKGALSKAATPSFSSDKLDFSSGVSEKIQIPTVSPQNVTEGGIMLLPTNAVLYEPMQQFTPPATSAKADRVKELTVSAGDNMHVMLPKNEVELNAFAVPPPSTGKTDYPYVGLLLLETAYTYEWSLISHPADYGGEMERRHSQTLKLSHLSVGLYAFKVTVSGENAFGEGFVNVTVKPERIDDMKIVIYQWEEIKGPLQEQKASADTPVLHLSNLVTGNYTFRLTVIDSDGAANSTIAFLTVNKPVDYPPTANAGPNQAVTLPQNFITLNGNQSSDDHEIVSYEWLLSPKSKGKGVRTPYLQLSAMQEGDYTFPLTVTDSARQRSTAEVTLVVQPENNSPPVAVAGPNKELTFPVESTTLDGSKSQDGQGIVLCHWESISSVQMENYDKAIATVNGLRVGTYRFRLTVKDQQGLSSASVPSITVKEALTLDSVVIVCNHQDVIHGSDHKAILQLTNLVEGTYTFHFKVADAKGDSDVDSATVEVWPACLLKCSGHGHCDPLTKSCICYQLWMENVIDHYLNDGESNCGIKHRSTEHNSSLMVSESEFDSDQDTICSREKIERIPEHL
ncbi:hypothetical protein WISP_87890 [Willisornis vidua]|uniref:PKD/Chitinase domain-containing protein n=1 Tax=Willisornis vidua TaxID=1566151 RepID=A0ABQ9D7N9_9PASS|nr:hypothetical protein WISP_87890 [Willisornis vidua]